MHDGKENIVEVLDLDARILLQSTVLDARVVTEFGWNKYGSVRDCCEEGNKSPKSRGINSQNK